MFHVKRWVRLRIPVPPSVQPFRALDSAFPGFQKRPSCHFDEFCRLFAGCRLVCVFSGPGRDISCPLPPVPNAVADRRCIQREKVGAVRVLGAGKVIRMFRVKHWVRLYRRVRLDAREMPRKYLCVKPRPSNISRMASGRMHKPALAACAGTSW